MMNSEPVVVVVVVVVVFAVLKGAFIDMNRRHSSCHSSPVQCNRFQIADASWSLVVPRLELIQQDRAGPSNECKTQA